MELSTRRLPRMADPAERVPGFGILLAHREEYMDSDEEWQELLDEGAWEPEDRRPTEWVWYVQYGPEPHHVYRWHNASFIAVPISRGFVGSGPAGHTDGVFTAGSLKEALADYGF